MTVREKHPLAGQTVRLNVAVDDPDHLNGQKYWIEDWWINVMGKSWQRCDGNIACMKYAMRNGLGGLPLDDEVVYGKVGPYGLLIHVSELGEVVEAAHG